MCEIEAEVQVGFWSVFENVEFSDGKFGWNSKRTRKSGGNGK